jgi:hypothetical protein
VYLPFWDYAAGEGFNPYAGDHWEYGYGGSTNIVAGTINPMTGGFVSAVYGLSFPAIARINIFLENLNGFTGMSDAKKKQYEGEARMLRAYYYGYLYSCYGDVPLVEVPATTETQFQAKKPAAEVLQFLLGDCDFGIANLPNITYGESKGRWTSNAAKAFKARMLLYSGYDNSGNAIASRMSDAKALLTGITGYSLAPEFGDNFHDLQQEACPEIMFSIKYLAPNDWTEGDKLYAGWNIGGPTANLISDFEMADGSPGTPVPTDEKGVIDPLVYNNDSMDLRDSRLSKTVFIDVFRMDGEEYEPGNIRTMGTGVYKYLSPNQERPYGQSTYSQQDWVLLRYADVLLMLAEAENEVSGPTTEAYQAINAVRQRSGMPALPSGLTQDQMRQRIRHERRVEFAFEGLRYFDLKRWRIAKEVINGMTNTFVPYHFEDKHYLWPLPQAEIDKANGVLIQNPDY